MKSVISLVRPTLIGLFCLVSCTTAPPTIPEATPANTTAEGLVRVVNSRFDEVHVRPGFDLTAFDSIILASVTVTYKSARPDNKLDDRQLDLMKRYFREELEEAFDESAHYRLVSEPDVNTLRVNAQITDLDINVPTDTRGIYRNRVFVASSGEMTLTAEVLNNRTGELLARIRDRRVARDHWHEVTSVTEWAQVRTAFRYWARIARDRVDAMYTQRL